MNIIELLILSFALAMDAFAISICMGLKMAKITYNKAIIVALYFGIFQALMPILGYLLAFNFSNTIKDYDHWIAFILLSILGIKLIRESFQDDCCQDRECPEQTCTDRKCPKIDKQSNDVSLSFKSMSILALATSIDAAAIGITFAFINVNIFKASFIIGLVTFIICLIGVKIGHGLGLKIKNKAELIGGLILIIIGTKILLEHLTII